LEVDSERQWEVAVGEWGEELDWWTGEDFVGIWGSGV